MGIRKEGREGSEEMCIPEQGRDTVGTCVSALGSNLI